MKKVTITNETDITEDVQKAVAKFDVNDAKIHELAEKVKGLSIAGVDDKKGYNAVDTARKEVKHVRTGINNVRKALTDDALRYKQAVDKYANELTAKVKVIEQGLEDKLAEVDKERERIEEEQRKAREQRVLNRHKELVAMGAMPEVDGNALCLAELRIQSVDIETYDDETWAKVVEKFEQEAHRIKEEARVAKEKAEAEERDRKAKEQAERERLDRQRKEQEQKEAEQAAQAKALEEQRLQMQQEKEQSRLEQLLAAGCERTDLTAESLAGYSSEEWPLAIERAKEARDVRIQREEREAIGKTRLKELTDMGASIANSELRLGALSGDALDIASCSDNDWPRLLDKFKEEAARVDEQQRLKQAQQQNAERALEISELYEASHKLREAIRYVSERPWASDVSLDLNHAHGLCADLASVLLACSNLFNETHQTKSTK